MPLLGAGTTTLGREVGEDDSYRLLDRAYELGFRVFDTAEAYGGGNARAYRAKTLGIEDIRETTGLMHSSEIILGRWIRSRGVRGEITLKTKVSSGFTASAIRRSLTASLDRLQTGSADVYYLHSMPAGIPLEEPLSVLTEEQRGGRIGGIGVSNFSLASLELARSIAPGVAYCQNVYNLALPEAEEDVIPYCRRNALCFVAYSPLGAGFLTGKYGARGEQSPAGTRFDVIPGHRDVYFHDSCFDALRRLGQLSAETRIPQHLLALAWVLRRPDIGIVLIGATRPDHLENAIEASRLSLDDGFWNRLDRAPKDH